jgi:hypothetical protein
MRSMRSMRGCFIFRSRGPLQKVCHGPAYVRPPLPSIIRASVKSVDLGAEQRPYKVVPDTKLCQLRNCDTVVTSTQRIERILFYGHNGA